MGSRFAACACLVAALGIAPMARAQPSAADRETARSLMDEGRELRDKKDLKAALDRFQRADDIMHVPTTGYEVARMQVSLGLLVEARDTIARVLHLPASPREPAPFRAARKNAQALDDSLGGRVPGLNITVKGAATGDEPKVVVDDVEIPSAALGVPRRVDPGHHVVTATTASARGTLEVDVAEGETKDVPVILVSSEPATAEPPAETAATESETPPAPPKHSYALAVAGFAAAGVAVGVGTITGVLTLSRKSALTSACANMHCPPSEFGALDGANTLATVSTVAFIAAGVGAAVGVIGVIVGKRKDAAPPAQAQVTPWLGPGMGGVEGRF
jgi:hypothetical protein